MQKRLKMKTLNCFFGNARDSEREREGERERCQVLLLMAICRICSMLQRSMRHPPLSPCPCAVWNPEQLRAFYVACQRNLFLRTLRQFPRSHSVPPVCVCVWVCVLRLDNALTTRSMSAGWVAWKADESWLKRPKTLGLRHPFNGAYD